MSANQAQYANLLLFLAALVACGDSHAPLDGGFVDTSTPGDSSGLGTVWDAEMAFRPNGEKLDVIFVLDEFLMTSGAAKAPIPWILDGLVRDFDVRVAYLSQDIGEPSGIVCDANLRRAGMFSPNRCDVGDPLFSEWQAGHEGVGDELIGMQVPCRIIRPGTERERGISCPARQPLDATLAAMLPGSSTEAGVLNVPTAHGDGENRNFFRIDAFLAIVVLTDRDDCSMTEPGLLSDERFQTDGTAGARCYAFPEALRSVDFIATTFARIRSTTSMGFYVLGMIPPELSGGPLDQMLSDPRMHRINSVLGTMIGGEFWDPTAALESREIVGSPPTRLVQLALKLTELGSDAAAFSVLGSVEHEANPFLTTAQPIVQQIAAAVRGHR